MMTGPIAIRVAGSPQGQPRPRARAIAVNGRHIASVYSGDTPAVKRWKAAIVYQSKRHAPATPLLGPLCVDLEFVMPRPKDHFKGALLKTGAPHFHTARPDVDNLQKAVLDELTKLGFWRDDSQVCDGRITKRYPRVGEEPGVEIVVRVKEDGAPGKA